MLVRHSLSLYTLDSTVYYTLCIDFHLKDLQLEVQNKQPTLESINSTGTSLVDGCRDDLSRDSVREGLIDINEKWGNLLSGLDKKSDKLEQCLKYSEKYETQEAELESWLNECETKLNKSVSGGLDMLMKHIKVIINLFTQSMYLFTQSMYLFTQSMYLFTQSMYLFTQSMYL